MIDIAATLDKFAADYSTEAHEIATRLASLPPMAELAQQEQQIHADIERLLEQLAQVHQTAEERITLEHRQRVLVDHAQKLGALAARHRRENRPRPPADAIAAALDAYGPLPFNVVDARPNAAARPDGTPPRLTLVNREPGPASHALNNEEADRG